MTSSRQTPSIRRQVDWTRVRLSKYLIHQVFSCEYPDHTLDHAFMVIPPSTFGDQQHTVYGLTISHAGEVITRMDSFANTVLAVHTPFVERSIEFDIWTTIERAGPAGPRALPSTWLHGPRLLETTDRTAPDAAISQAAEELRATGAQGLELAEQINDWVHSHMAYLRDATGVHTTTAEALAGGVGVCQDYSHVMISICRLLDLPTLYVSGHQFGEGGTHSWVEVILPAADGSDSAEGWPLDPTHGCRGDLTYLTVATGREYGDVAPTSGSYRAGHGGTLTGHKKVLVTEIAYFD